MIDRLNKNQQRYLAVALLFLVAIIFYLVAVLPVTTAIKSNNDAIDDLEFRLQRMKKIKAGEPQLLQRLEQVQQQQAQNKHFSDRKTAALASADLQKFIKNTVVDAGGRLTSTQVVPAETEDQFVRIAIKVRMSGNSDILRNVLYEIENRRPMLIVDNLNLRPIRGRRDPKTRKLLPSDQLNVNLDISGYMRGIE